MCTNVNEKVLADFKKMNKVARERRALKLGYADAASYMNALLAPVPTSPKTGAPKKEKKVKAVKENVVIHVVDILDVSGSMEGPKIRGAERGINVGIRDLNLPGVNYKYTLCLFSSFVRFDFVDVNPASVPEQHFYTVASTALYDAIGETVVEMGKHVKAGEKVLINIYTDGQENSSRKYKSADISRIIEDYSKEGYTFTFVGTSHDVDFVNRYLKIDVSNSRVYDGSAADLERGLNDTRSARVAYSSSVLKGEDVSKGFYKNINK